jgi:hypothetical protein
MMDRSKPIPTSLKAVAVLFIVTGVFSLVEVVVSLMNSSIDINFGVLGLFIGPGLLRLSRGWRSVALALLVISAIGLPIVALLFLGAPGPLDFNVFGQQIGYASKELGIGLAIVLFVLVVWQYRVLTSEDVRRPFETPDEEPAAVGERLG